MPPPPAPPPGALPIRGLWQFSAPTRCGDGGYGNRDGAPTGGSSRHVAPLGVMAVRSLPQPQFPQRAERGNCHNPNSRNAVGEENCHNPQIDNAPVGSGRTLTAPGCHNHPNRQRAPQARPTRRTNAYSRADPESSPGQTRSSRARVLVNRDLCSASLAPCTGGTAWYTLHPVALPCEKYDWAFVRPCQISALPGEPCRAAASMRLLSRKRSSIRLSQPGGAVPSPIYD